MNPLTGISVVVPAFDEEESIRGTILEAIPVLRRLAAEWEIVVVDDGSRDGTSREVERLRSDHPEVRLFRHPENRGFGAAFRTGLAACRCEFVTLIPADGQFPPADLAKLAAVADGCDLVLGVRGNRGDPLYRRINTFFLRWFLLFLFGITARDSSWVKLFRRKSLLALGVDLEGFAIDTQILARVCRKGYRVRQVPVGYRARTGGEAKGGQFRRVAKTVWEILTVWMRETLR